MTGEDEEIAEELAYTAAHVTSILKPVHPFTSRARQPKILLSVYGWQICQI